MANDGKIININGTSYLIDVDLSVTNLNEKFGDFTKIFLSNDRIIILYEDTLKYKPIGRNQYGHISYFKYTTVKIDNVKKVLYDMYYLNIILILKNNGKLYGLEEDKSMNLIMKNIDDINDNYTVISNNKLYNFCYNDGYKLEEAFNLPLKLINVTFNNESVNNVYKYNGEYYYFQNKNKYNLDLLIYNVPYVVSKIKKYYFNDSLLHLHNDDCIYDENGTLIRKDIKKIFAVSNALACVNLDNTIDLLFEENNESETINLIWQDKFKFIKSARN